MRSRFFTAWNPQESCARGVPRRTDLVLEGEFHITYEYFLYDGRQHLSMSSLPGMAQRTITIAAYSKTFSITGWRIYVCAPTAVASRSDWRNSSTIGRLLSTIGEGLSSKAGSDLRGVNQGGSGAVGSSERPLCPGGCHEVAGKDR